MLMVLLHLHDSYSSCNKNNFIVNSCSSYGKFHARFLPHHFSANKTTLLKYLLILASLLLPTVKT